MQSYNESQRTTYKYMNKQSNKKRRESVFKTPRNDMDLFLLWSLGFYPSYLPHDAFPNTTRTLSNYHLNFTSTLSLHFLVDHLYSVLIALLTAVKWPRLQIKVPGRPHRCFQLIWLMRPRLRMKPGHWKVQQSYTRSENTCGGLNFQVSWPDCNPITFNCVICEISLIKMSQSGQ